MNVLRISTQGRNEKKEKKEMNPTRKRGKKNFDGIPIYFSFLNTNGRARSAPLVSLWFEET